VIPKNRNDSGQSLNSAYDGKKTANVECSNCLPLLLGINAELLARRPLKVNGVNSVDGPQIDCIVDPVRWLIR
jgi:hypothetical protein